MSNFIEPMEALLAEELPDGPGWQFEPKWDGFRCIAVRDGAEVELWSKSGKPLGRYFPEVAAMLGRLKAKRFVLDGELLIASGGAISFDALQLRLHPAESRIAKLAAETPAMFMAFDCLALGSKMLTGEPLARPPRRRWSICSPSEREPALLLSPATTDRDEALGWLDRGGGALDGVIAKRLDQPYRAGRAGDGQGQAAPHRRLRRRRLPLRPQRQAESASLLLGLYDDAGLLHHVGFTSSIAAKDRAAWTEELEALIEPPGFTGNAPGGPSRWSTERTAEWQPLTPRLVVEVLYDQVTGGRFRHGTKLLRRRPDKAPRQCTCDQLAHR